MSDLNTEAALLEFLSTFRTLSGPPPESLAELGDGVALFEALAEIAPDYFDPTTVARHVGDNWALKSSNLRKLVRNLELYYHEALHKDASFGELSLPEMARGVASPQPLVELVAAAAVTCDSRSEFVSRIMALTAESQLSMKTILQQALGRLSDYHNVMDEEENELVFDDDDYNEEQQERHQDGRNLFGTSHNTASGGAEDIAVLEEQLAQAKREIAALKSQSVLQLEDSTHSQHKLKALVEDLQDRLLKRQDELIGVEEELQQTTAELDDTKAKLLVAMENNKQLEDDLDVAKAKTHQLHKAEATLVAYKKKLEAVGVMNQQMTDLEDQAATYLRQIMELETQVKKSNALQKLVTDLQEQISTLERHKVEQEAAAKTAMTEVAHVKTQLAAAEKSRKGLEDELHELRAQQESWASEAAAVPSSPAHHHGQELSPRNHATSSKEQREKMVRLEIENQKLQEEMEKLKKSLSSPKAVVEAHSTRPSSADVAAMQAEMERLQEDLAVKERENAKISGDKDKLEAYTKRTLAKFQDKYLVALQECKAKLKEKQDKIEALEMRSQAERTAQKREERLLSSTIYELGMAIMQNRLKDR